MFEKTFILYKINIINNIESVTKPRPAWGLQVCFYINSDIFEGRLWKMMYFLTLSLVDIYADTNIFCCI